MKEFIYIRRVKQISFPVQDKYVKCLKEFMNKSVEWVEEEGTGKSMRGERSSLIGMIRIWFH